LNAELPMPSLILPTRDEIAQLSGPALLIAVVGFIESISVAQALAARRHQRIAPNQELCALGLANLGSGACGGFAVAGGLARSGVNFAAGAHTPLAGGVSALLITLSVMFAGPGLAYLPQAVLAASVVAAVLGLMHFSSLFQALRQDRGDACAWLATFLGVLTLGVEQGMLGGVLVSFAVLLWRAAHPHLAVVGRVPGTEHFRNVERHRVDTLPQVLAVRVDENLFFGNARAIEERLNALLAEAPATREVLLIGSAINHIDTTALAMLEAFELRLSAEGRRLSLAEIKGPVMAQLQHSALMRRLDGRVWLSTHAAFMALRRPPS
jgi:SulP family sulfate permease